MLSRRFLAQLQRLDNEEELEKEPFEQYLARVRPLLPRFPEEVIRDWVYRHCQDLYGYDWLDFDRFAFRRETWATERVIRDVQTWNEETVAAWEHLIDDGEPRRLESYMLAEGTWPVPISVIDSPHAIPRRRARFFKGPFQLLEGHHRLAHLRTLARTGRARAEHAIWIAEWQRPPARGGPTPRYL